MRLWAAVAAAAALLLAADSARGGGEPRTINEFFARGTPTFIAGTLGNEDADRKIRAQIDLVRGMLFPGAQVVTDSDVLLGEDGQGSDEWPENPVLYGGPEFNLVLRERVKDRLPFGLTPGKLVIGDHTFEGNEYRIICVVPGKPSFLLYAGTGSPGVAEINGTPHGPTAFVVADRFGPVTAGFWDRREDGRLVPRFSGFARRIEWRATEPEKGLRVLRPKMIPASEGDAAVDEACARAAARAREKLGLAEGGPIEVHVYPDRRSKQSLTGDGGDGRADILSSSIHVLPFDARECGALESLVAHEATHVLAYHEWGPPGTPLLAEGLAVWASGQYGGRTLGDWAKAPPNIEASVPRLMGPEFRRLPERDTYPVAGILTGVLVEMVGLAKFRDHIYPATPDAWAEACGAAGTTPVRVQAALLQALGY